MRKHILLSALCCIVFFACNKSETQSPMQPQSTVLQYHNFRLSNPEDRYDGFEDFLEWFDALYETGDFAIITNGNPGVIVTSYGTDPSPDPAAKHSYEATNKYKFAKWCNDHLNAGDCLKAGKNGDTYWADIVPC